MRIGKGGGGFDIRLCGIGNIFGGVKGGFMEEGIFVFVLRGEWEFVRGRGGYFK